MGAHEGLRALVCAHSASALQLSGHPVVFDVCYELADHGHSQKTALICEPFQQC